jgi:hypothetical protein
MEKLAAEYMEVVYEEKRIAERKEELKAEMVKLIGEDEAKIEIGRYEVDLGIYVRESIDTKLVKLEASFEELKRWTKETIVSRFSVKAVR